ncbi:hypothetical protein RSAG8_12014, partial [Rhizoctonia solani AG-8 WAC10335]
MTTILLASGAAVLLSAACAKLAINKKSVLLQQQIQTPPQILNTDSGGSKCQTQDGSSRKPLGLIIGIDTYSQASSLGALAGAVNDANDMVKFLMSDLGVPADHIIKICDKEATRERIIQEFQALSNNQKIERGDPILIYYAGHGGLEKANEKIERGDPILIYYAGHGGLEKANEEWSDKHGAKHIQVIFPYDYGCRDTESANPGILVNCIPDRTIANLLNELANKKGDNITVIFDSCHSGSGTRSDESSPKPTGRDRRYRSAKVQFEIPSDIDSHLTCTSSDSSIKQHRDAKLLLYTDQSSHVHLAACRANEKAIEEDGHGVFTAELLEKVRQNRVDKITYRNLIKSLTIPEGNDQSPECYGKYKDRILFDSRISSSSSYIDVEVHGIEEISLTLKAGAASGVTLESIWEIHQSSVENSEPVGDFKVTGLYASMAILKPLDSKELIPNINDYRLYARCKRIGPGNGQVLKVWMSPDDEKVLFPGPDQYVGSTHESGIGYTMTQARDDADIVLEIYRSQPTQGSINGTEAEVAFYWHDSVSKKNGVEELPYRKPAVRRQVEVVLFAAAKWKWYLRHEKANTGKTVTMSMVKVATRDGPLLPRDPLERPEDVTETDGIVELKVENSPIPLYGFKLKSNIKSPLHVRMFYFDTTDFSIEELSEHSAGSGEITADIPPTGQMLIGDGADGGAPIRFSLSSTKPKELGYMKVFWSTHQLELDHIKQKSAFKLRPGDLRGSSRDHDSFDSQWGTACLKLILRK